MSNQHIQNINSDHQNYSNKSQITFPKRKKFILNKRTMAAGFIKTRRWFLFENGARKNSRISLRTPI
jgi:hypothetical protein